MEKCPQLIRDNFLSNPKIVRCEGAFTHADFDAISDAISRTKRALPYPARMHFTRSIARIEKKVITLFEDTLFPISAILVVSLSQRYATNNPCGVGWGKFCTQEAKEVLLVKLVSGTSRVFFHLELCLLSIGREQKMATACDGWENWAHDPWFVVIRTGVQVLTSASWMNSLFPFICLPVQTIFSGSCFYWFEFDCKINKTTGSERHANCQSAC